MCGQVGFLIARRKRTPAQWMNIAKSFLYLMVYSEAQGPHATGMAIVRENGSFSLFKRPGRAHKVIQMPEFTKLLGKLDSTATLLMGHTRYRTRGSEKRNRNNHPLRAGKAIGTHNGTIVNADELFEYYGLSRRTEVDSELLVRMVHENASLGPIDVRALLRHICPCKGQISAILTSLEDPESTLVLVGNRPLSLWRNPKLGLVAYASQAKWLEKALENQEGWIPMDSQPMSLLVFQRSRLGRPKRYALEFETHETITKEKSCISQN